MRSSRPDEPGTTYYPLPSGRVRAAGAAGILGAVLWPFAIVAVASAAQGCTTADCQADRGTLAQIALPPICFAITVLALELRTRRFATMGDLVGDLTVGTSAALFVLALTFGTVGFLGPGLMLLLIGSVVFGITGFRNGARQRLASAVVAVGAASMLVLLFSGAFSGFGAGLEGPWLLALLLFAVGWGWLGGHLLFARPLPVPPGRTPGA